MWSRPPVVLQGSLHLWPWRISYQNPQMPQEPDVRKQHLPDVTWAMYVVLICEERIR